ncbi:MAG TPA: glycosyltransferase family 39 protein [Vicinamibacterales bacterium]|nr:glycosyltransferase family 39 protein [Vicinamibacterales bacterium]
MGDTTIGYHLINIVLHAMSAWLLTIILRRLAVPGAFLAAVIFALHPVAAESVAWMTELKNTLSGVCYLAAALAYLRFDARRERRAYAASFVFFVLALLAKTVTAVLPAALLVVFWWKRGSIDRRRDVRPLVPFFVIGGAVGVVTAWFERTLNGARGFEFQASAIERMLIAGQAI